MKRPALLLGISLVSFLFFGASGITLYRYVQARRNVLGAQNITKMKKKDYIFFNTGSFSRYYEPKPNNVIVSRHEWLPHEVSYTINNEGLNERFNYQEEKPIDTFRILTIGDSFTFGQNVNTKDNFSERLEDLLNSQPCSSMAAYEVINFGIPGYDIGYTVAHFKEKGMKYHPDLVVWLINAHNLLQIRDFISEREDEILAAMSDDERTRREKEGTMYVAAGQATVELISAWGKERILKTQEEYLRQFTDLYAGPLVVIKRDNDMDPDALVLIQQYTKERPNTWVYDGLSDLGLTHGLLPDGHPNEKGHLVIALNLFHYLHEHNLISCAR